MKKKNSLQMILLEMMKEFHEFCVENDISYYMLGGTMIGAIRHKGFIPWDDDIDIGIPRKDYEKLLSIDKSKLPINLEIISYKSNKKYPFAFAKLFNKNTTLIENTTNGLIGGVYIDLFPIDGAGVNRKIAKYHFKLIKLNNSFLWFSQNNDETIGIKKYVKAIAKFIGVDFWQKSIDKVLKLYSYEKSNYIGNLLGVYNEKEIVPKSYFGTPKLYEFEDTKFYGMEKYDEYLKNIYGDYMKLPPIDKQKSHHKIAYLDLNLPYNKYKQNLKKRDIST